MEVDGSRRTMVRLCGLVFSVVVREYRFDSLLDLQIYIARRLGWFEGGFQGVVWFKGLSIGCGDAWLLVDTYRVHKTRKTTSTTKNNNA